MIIIYVGGIGSGKTISAMKELATRPYKAYTNFKTFNINKPLERLKWSQIYNKIPKEHYKDGRVKKWDYTMNYEYWRKQIKQEPFDIFIDEMQEMMHSRRGQSHQSICGTKWVSQIRKILGYDEENHLYVITQRPRSIDIHCRELAQYWIYCDKITLPIPMKTKMFNGKTKILPTHIIRQYLFDANQFDYENVTLERIQRSTSRAISKSGFIANPLIQFYDSYQLVDFGNEEFV